MPAIAEHTVVGPVGGHGADRYHGDVVYQEHDDREDGQTQPTVGDHAVNLIGDGQLTGALLLVAGLDHLGDVHITLIGDNTLGVVAQLILGGLDVGLDVLHRVGGHIQLLQHLAVALKDLDGVPALLGFGQVMQGGFLDVGNGMLHRAGEGVHGNGLAVAGGVNRGLGGLHDALALQSGNLTDLAAQLTGQFAEVDLIAVLADNVHHVDGHNHRDTQLGQLRGQVQVALQVGTVDQVQDCIRALGDQVITGNDFFQRVRRQGVNAGQVGDDDVVVLAQAAFLLFYGNAGPVAHKLIGAGQGVEQRGFTAVRVACQCDFNGH